ncbi:glycosyltransferase family 87 protein [Saccharopolyspora sp. NPDC002376]
MKGYRTEGSPISRTARGLTVSGLVALCVLTALSLALGYANKARCTGPEFDEWGRSEPAYQERAYGDVCYSDIQNLWIGRDIDQHVFPYVHGGIEPDGSLYGGVVEYPVLSGLLMWAGAYFVDTDAGFLAASALLMAPFGLATAWWLGRLSGWRALLWALSPPLVLYAFHNWDLPVVACAVAAVFVVHRWTSVSLRRRATVAAVILGLGFALKIYPAMFVLPLALYVLTSGKERWDVRGALQVVGASVATAVVANVPFMIAGFGGWLASFEFQSRRQVDISTNSIWYWGFRDWTGSADFQSAMSVVSPLLILLSFTIACVVGWLRYERCGTYPWIPVSAAMLVGFLLLHKVHSPQYTLWLLPFFVLVRVRWGWIVAYLVADLAMGISIFRWLYLNMMGEPSGIHDGFTAQALMIGVWGRAALLVGLFIVFLKSRSTVESPGDERVLPGRPAPRLQGA